MRLKLDYRTTSKETFKRFKLKHPEVKLTYTEWCDIIYSFNYAFRDYCLESGGKAKFPYGVGTFCITKYKKRSFKEKDGKKFVNLAIDWQATKKKGFTVYHRNGHTDGYSFKWYWMPNTQRFSQSDIWAFKPSRESSRLINHYVKQGYSEKYLQWKTH